MLKVTFTCILVLAFSFSENAFGDPISTEIPDTNVDDVNDGDIAKQKLLDVKWRDRSQSIIDAMLADQSDLVYALMNDTCNSLQQMQSNVLKTHSEKIIKLLFLRWNKRSNLNWSVIIKNINLRILEEIMQLNDTKLDNLILNNTKVKGMEKASLSKLNFDLCSLTNEIEVKAPLLEIETNYKVKGIFNGSDLHGDGKIKIVIEGLYLHDKSFLTCKKILTKDMQCDLSLKHKEQDIQVKNITVNITGVKYKDMTEAQINEKINNFIQSHLLLNKNLTMQNILSVIHSYKEKLLNSLNIVQLLREMKKGLSSVHNLNLPNSHNGLLDNINIGNF